MASTKISVASSSVRPLAIISSSHFCGNRPKDASWEDVVSESKAGGYNLITTDELWEKYTKGRDNLLIVTSRLFFVRS